MGREERGRGGDRTGGCKKTPALARAGFGPGESLGDSSAYRRSVLLPLVPPDLAVASQACHLA